MLTQRSPILATVKGMGATLGVWYQWEVPLHFGNMQREYWEAQENVVIHDASYVGRIKATGVDVLDLLNRLSTNGIEDLALGQGAPTVLTNDKGRIIDLVYVINMGSHVLLLTSQGCEDRILRWIEKYTFIEDATLSELTSSTALFTLVGPKAADVVEAIAGVDVKRLRRLDYVEAIVQGVPTVIIDVNSVDSSGYHLMIGANDASKIWQRIVSYGTMPIGVLAWEALRIKAGVPLYGKEIGEGFNPLESGLIGSVDFAKGCYIGQEVIARLDTYEKVQKHLVTLKFSDCPNVQEGTKLALDGKEVGVVTSASEIPDELHQLGLGYVRKVAANVGVRLSLVGQQGAWAEIAEIPLLCGPMRE